MLVSATKFKANIGKYLSLASKEEIIITKNGKIIAKLTGIDGSEKSIVDSLTGILPDRNIDLAQAREERLARHESID